MTWKERSAMWKEKPHIMYSQLVELYAHCCSCTPVLIGFRERDNHPTTCDVDRIDDILRQWGFPFDHGHWGVTERCVNAYQTMLDEREEMLRWP